MKITHSTIKIGLASVFLAALTGCTTYVVERPAPQVYTPPPPPPAPVVVQESAPPPPPPAATVVIQSDDDFYQPLSAYGEWVVVSGYGRVWRPANVEAGWRPYANGNWELTDDGWYWESDEPWGWATYHYGRWELSAGYGWIWVPQTEWAPAWVEWREGGGYVGWAPLPPARVGVSVTVAPATFCFVDERRMHDPVRPTTVIVNNTTVVNKTVVINKTKVVNKVVIHDGPGADEVARVTGKQIQKVSVTELRHKDEQVVVQRQHEVQVRTDNHPQTGIQERPENHQGNPPKTFDLPHPQPAHVEEVSAPERKPLQKEVSPAPAPVQPQPLPVVPPREEHPGNNRAVPFAGENPKPTPIAHEPAPVEKPGHAPTVEPNKEHQQGKPQFNLKGSQRQKNNPAPKNNANDRNARGHEASGTNATENVNQRR